MSVTCSLLDPEEIKTAIDTARKSPLPTLICCKTTIGFGSPNIPPSISV